MQVIRAEWEKRNIGVDCVELNAESDDSLNEFSSAIEQLTAEYQVIRIPAGRTDMLLAAQTLGYRVIEMNAQLSRSTQGYTLPSIYRRFESQIDIVQADQEGVRRALDEIRSGNVFVTDRVAKDPFFGPEKRAIAITIGLDVLDEAGGSTRSCGNEAVGLLSTAPMMATRTCLLGGVFPGAANRAWIPPLRMCRRSSPRKESSQGVDEQPSDTEVAFVWVHHTDHELRVDQALEGGGSCCQR